MNYKGYKMVFQSGVHFGNKSIESCEYTFHADTLFSALCHEALKLGDDSFDKLISWTKSSNIILSDAMPYYGDTLYISKPMKRIEYEEQGDSSIKKAFKNLTYIPTDKISEYLTGCLDVKSEQNKLGQLGVLYSRDMVAVRGKEEAMPYRVGVFHFYEGNGLYFILGYNDEQQMELIETLLDQVSFAGIGGKRSSGLGRFYVDNCSLGEDMKKRLDAKGDTYMSLSIALPNDSELEQVITNASYQLIKRSGFVASDKYADDFLRKRDLYVMNAGACFSVKFNGDVYDVSSDGSHPVYRYAKPFLVEVDA